jgi:hypothetical protein
MEEATVAQVFVAHVIGAEIIVCARMVQKAAVTSRGTNNNGIRSAGLCADGNSVSERGRAFCHHLFYDAPELICAYSGEKSCFNPKSMQCQSRVGDCSTCCSGGRPNVNQPSRLKSHIELPSLHADKSGMMSKQR